MQYLTRPLTQRLSFKGISTLGTRYVSSTTPRFCAQKTPSRGAFSDFETANARYAVDFAEKGLKDLPAPPAKRLAIVTCMDARINVLAHLGLKEGDAHIIRNAGGSAQEALRSLIISQRLLHTREIAVFHHTDCGMIKFTTPGLRRAVKDAQPGDDVVARAVDEMEFHEWADLDLNASVERDVAFLKGHPLVVAGTVVTGWVFRVETGKIIRVV